uniref:(northern house mosquito) hypothetical protein n=1 Tax=Culex pipiens TaxID=7175 RepID=A0A8D8L2Y9_CULPI
MFFKLVLFITHTHSLYISIFKHQRLQAFSKDFESSSLKTCQTIWYQCIWNNFICLKTIAPANSNKIVFKQKVIKLICVFTENCALQVVVVVGLRRRVVVALEPLPNFFKPLFT